MGALAYELLAMNSLLRSVTKVIDTVRVLEGGGFPVRRPFPTATLDHVDPFLLLDHLGPVEWAPNDAIGAPAHPHRGFETVSYILAGALEHRDSAGNHGKLGPGDVQWMTAGAGVIQSELPDPAFKRSGGVMHGFQIWVNLPAAKKMMAPRYQEVRKSEIPIGRSEDGKVEVRVIAGEAMGVHAKIDTVTPILYQHWILAPGGTTRARVPEGWRGMVYVFEGALDVAGRRVKEGQLARLSDAGDELELLAVDVHAELLLLAGVPLEEPVARHGPFVMNTRAQLIEAFEDYQAGRLTTRVSG
jgi:redox-sensitive bicupin YhaK (pirin superfamily)